MKTESDRASVRRGNRGERRGARTDHPSPAPRVARTAPVEPAVLPKQYTELAGLAGAFIHDIKNHLGTLSLNLQLLAEDFQDPQTHRERRALDRVQKLRTECGRLVDLSNDFLRYARVKDLNLAPADLGQVVEEITDFFLPTARVANIGIKLYVPPDLPAVALDREVFNQALLNLLLNAQQAMPEGGEITLQASATASEVCLNLIDTGQGMPPEVAARAFEPFYSTKPGGSGLGLATTRKIIEAHGGTIEVQSSVGHGTKFSVRLPAARPASSPDSPSEAHV
jgi:signal transduction histidine kinase